MNDVERNVVRLGTFGFVMGALVSCVIIMMICSGDRIVFIHPGLSKRYGEAIALILQILLPGIMGAIDFATTVIYDSERFNLVTATCLHASIVFVLLISVGSFMEWFELTPVSVLLFMALMAAIYIMIWFLMYASSRSQAEEINKMLERKRSKGNE